MPQFPDATALPGLPGGGERRVAGFDTAPLERGGEAMGSALDRGGRYYAAAVGEGGQAIGRGVEQLGKGVGAAGEGMLSYELDQERWQYASAHSQFLSSATDLQGTYKNDQNYGDMSARFATDQGKLRDDAAATIDAPAMRERFINSIGPQMAAQQNAIDTHAKSLEANAQVAWVEGQGDKFIDQGTSTTDPTVHQQIFNTHAASIDALAARGFITPETARTMKQNWAHQYAIADGLQRSKTDPQGVINDLQAAPGSEDAIVNRIIHNEGNGQNPNSTSQGIGGFTDKTWVDIVKQKRPDLAKDASDDDILSMRADKSMAREMVLANLDDNKRYLQGAGVPPTPANLYLAHFLGPKSAAAVASADPNVPIAKVLADAVGPDKAKEMIQANPSVLLGQQSGSVQQWADGKMGGASAGGVHLYDVLRPDQRALLLQHAQTQLSKQQTGDQSALRARIGDSLAEADVTGFATKPVTQAEFIAVAGPKDGMTAFKTYQDDLKLKADKVRVATMGPEDQDALLQQYAPKPGPGYADQVRRIGVISKAISDISDEKQKDPAQFAIRRLPASGEAFNKFSQTLSDPQASDDDRKAAAADYATKTRIEQSNVGIPPDAQRILPQGYVDHLSKAITAAGDSDDPQKRTGLVQQVQREAALWGDNWPAVMRQIAPTSQPIVRAIAAGADPTAMTRLLSMPKGESPAVILKEQDATKAKDLTTALNTEMQPLLRSMVGRQKDRDYTPLFDLAQKLGALHVRDGDDAPTAAAKAFREVVGNQYDFRDTFMIPKSAGVSPDEVQKGTLMVRSQLGRGPQIDTSFDQAKTELGMTAQEQALYQRHLTNLTGAGGVDNPDGSRSTLFQMSFERDGKTYNIPTVWDGKILKPDEAIKRADREGIDKFPSYASEDEAEARYGKMHDYMEQDTARYLQKRKTDPLANVRAPVDDMPGRTDAARVDLGLVGRDGSFVTAPDGSGLSISYNDKFLKDTAGKPLVLPWAKVAEIGRTMTPAHVEALARRGVWTAGKFAD